MGEREEMLSGDKLIELIRAKFEKIEDKRAENSTISLADALMSAFAMFSLKDSSLLAFDKRRKEGDENLERIYGIKRVPSDSQLRNIVDEVEPKEIRKINKEIIEEVRRSGLLEDYRYLSRYYLLPVDGTGYYSSKNVNCEQCLQKKKKETGEVTYHHQLLEGAIVHPDKKEVLPICTEPIIKQDGVEKNDCELNASKRFYKKVREDYPYLPFLVVEDSLYGNGPHIKMLRKHNLEFIILVKKDSHQYLFNYVAEASQKGETKWFRMKEGKTEHHFQFINDVPLNKSNQDVRVNFLEYWEISPTETRHWTWVTGLHLSTPIVYHVMRGGRARWKIENETFNTLKNQGYNFEHNYGHGQNNLSVNFASLMLLAFLGDQVQQLGHALFQKALAKQGSRKLLWERMRALFYALPFHSLSDILRALAYGYTVKGVVISPAPL